MDPAHESVRFGSHDGEGLEPMPFLVFPGMSNTRDVRPALQIRPKASPTTLPEGVDGVRMSL